MSDKVSNMTAVAELRDKFITLCGPKSLHDNKKSWLAKGVRAAGITYRTGRGLWNNEVRNPCLSTVKKIEAAYAAHLERQRKKQEGIDERIAKLEADLVSLHQELLSLKAGRADHQPR